MVGLIVAAAIFFVIAIVFTLSVVSDAKLEEQVDAMKPGDIYYYVKVRSNPWEQDVVLFAEVLEVKEQWVKYMYLDNNRLRFGKALQEQATQIAPVVNFLSLYRPYQEGQTEFVYPYVDGEM